ncbi:MAG TPA: sugar phosphate isomerase/epimerase family protein [Terriglobales bacterium]|nr:sugar phosphate isomerase/epimerase family protein [Terriglobales bacterium]
MNTRREFLSQSVIAVAGATLMPALAGASTPQPNVAFPSNPRDRIAIASYPFRDFILPAEYVSDTAKTSPKIELAEFAAHVVSRFGVNKIEPWSAHFRSRDPKYLENFRAAVDKAKAAVVNIAYDGEHSIYAADSAERDRAIADNRKWVDAAAALGSPSIRTHIASDRDQPPDLDRAADSLRRIGEHAAARNVVIHLENDDGVTEDPFFLAKLIENVASPWVCALPDFGNSLMHLPPDKAYDGLEAMFSHAYGISHVKGSESTGKGARVQVDLAYAFGLLKKSGYRGYLSMEYDDAGDPYQNTQRLIDSTLQLMA